MKYYSVTLYEQGSDGQTYLAKSPHNLQGTYSDNSSKEKIQAIRKRLRQLGMFPLFEQGDKVEIKRIINAHKIKLIY